LTSCAKKRGVENYSVRESDVKSKLKIKIYPHSSYIKRFTEGDFKDGSFYELGDKSNVLLFWQEGSYVGKSMGFMETITTVEMFLINGNGEIISQSREEEVGAVLARQKAYDKLIKSVDIKNLNSPKVNWVTLFNKNKQIAKAIDQVSGVKQPSLKFEGLLHSLIQQGNAQLYAYFVEYLYNDFFVAFNGKQLIHSAIQYGNKAILSTTYSKFSDLSITDNHGVSAKEYLYEYPNWQSTDFFIQANTGVIKDISSEILNSLLGLESRDGSKPVLSDYKFQLIDKLLELGANVNIRDKRGNSPIHYATQINSKKVIDIFLRSGANINASNASGRSPLFFAFPTPNEALQQNHKSLINYLVEHGANPILRDSTGLTASEFYGQRRNEFLVAKAKAEEAERRRLARVAEEKRLEQLRKEREYIAQQKRRAKEKKAEHDAWMLGVAVVNTLANGYVDAMKQKAANDAAMQAIASQQQSYNDNVRANEQKRKQDAQQYKRDWEQQMSRAKADAAQRTAERESFQKQLMQSFNKSSGSTTFANNDSVTYNDTNSNVNSNNSSTKQDTRTKYVAKSVDISTSGGAWETKEKAFEWLSETVSSKQLRRACDLTRIVPQDVQNVTYRKTGSGRFHAKGTALGYCEISSSSSKYKNIGWCSTKGFNFSKRHGCALPSPM